MKVEFNGESEIEIDQAANYDAGQKPGLDLEILQELAKAVSHIENFPNAAPVDWQGMRCQGNRSKGKTPVILAAGGRFSPNAAGIQNKKSRRPDNLRPSDVLALVPRHSTRLKRRARSRMTATGWFKRLPWMRHASLARFPYVLIDRVVGGVAKVYAIAHQRRRPGYWRMRVDA